MTPSESVPQSSRRAPTARDVVRFPHGGQALDDFANALMESFPGYVAVLDAAYTVVATNRAWIDLNVASGTRSIACAVVGDNYMTTVLSALENREEATRVAALLDGARESGALVTPITVRTPDDRQLSVNARRVRGGSAIVVACVDVSEWAGSVRALHQAQRELIDAAQLAVAGELVGGIAHDLRQPLAAIEMNVSVATHLLRQTPPETTSALVALDDAIKGANVLRESVQVLQDLVAKREPAFEDVNIATIVDDVIALVQAEASARGLVIERLVAAGDRIPSIQADASMLREAVLALMLDAVENADATVPDARILISARPVENNVELLVHHRAQAGPAQVSVWARSVARSVADAHGASMSVDVDTLFGTTVRTTWPAVRVTRSIIE